MRMYLLGYSWGVETPMGMVFMHEKRVARSPMTGGRAVPHNETVIYKTKAQATKAALDHLKTTAFPDSLVFIHGARYETNRPEHAKGLPEWEDQYGEREILNPTTTVNKGK